MSDGVDIATNTTPSPAPEAAPSAGVMNLLRRINAVRDIRDQYDTRGAIIRAETGQDRKWKDETDRALSAREEALIALAETTPAVTLGDALAQVMLAFEHADNVAGNVLSEDQQVAEGRTMCRLLASIMPVLASAAGIILTDVIDAYTVERCASFAPLAEGEPLLFASVSRGEG